MEHIDLAKITLARGAHRETGPDNGACAMEWVAVLAREPFSDHPSCTSPVLAAFVRRWNDALPDEPRQELRKFLPRLVGTAGDREADTKRAYIATDWSVRVMAPMWLRLAKLETEAKSLESVGEIVDTSSAAAAQGALRVARDAAYKATERPRGTGSK